ncbi:protocadherin Fat 4-like [Asterias rubens]|uniref:protocadherin Fat 4-like n=1 Tax=Asterias rubens TaxID=7604 RepID=UPI0014553614|nr:protocadherin Fat 4-like [Asterias rubens]
MRLQLHRRRDWIAAPVSSDGKDKHKTMTLNNLARNRRRMWRMSSSVAIVCHLTLFLALFGFASGQTSDLVFTINEEQPPGVLVGEIPTESGFTYTFSDPPVEFELNRNNGEIRTSQIIDREQLRKDVFDLLVLATSNSRTNPIEVRIIVADLNDNSPAFPEPTDRISFSENRRIGTQVILESATDPDKASNGNIVQYSISDGNSENAFRLVVIPGPDGLPIYIHLETTFSLDYESQDFYQLTISARDDGSPSRSGVLHLNISVLDMNDNPPIFDQSEFIISINESTPAGTRLLDVHATDGDSGINGVVEYFIDEDTSKFDVEPDSGTIILQEKLDYVSSDPYQVTVKARDKGSPTLYGRAFLSVFVIDENDHDPQISFGFYSDTGNFATVTEGAAMGSIVALVTVTDGDQGENGEVSLQILNGNELQHFILETLTLLVPGFSQANIFKLLVASDVDRENVEQYNLTLVAHDNGSPRRQTTESLIIHVVDTNDHPPEFQATDYHAVLSEGEPIGSFVESLTATDADSGLNAVIVYSISAGNDLQWFEIDSETGLVTTKAQLDREVASVIELNITAIDQGVQPMSSSTTLTVTILDENDEAPVFTNPPYTTSVPENIIGRFEVISVLAVDGDQGTNGLVRYAFTADVEHQYPGIFSIDAVSGTIFTETALNHEDVSEYDLIVRAFDAGETPKESLANVHVDVGDENDNVPVFYPQTYLVTIQENEPENTFVERVTASDSDSGNYGTLTYSIISGNAAGKFQIDGSTGEVTTTSGLDREEESSYTLVISAVDGGGQAAELNSEVYISVGDIQDNPPTFDESRYEFEILESAVSNALVGQVTASSQDLNAQITYTIFSGDPNGQFEINDINGEIRTSRDLDRETTPSFELTIYASGKNLFGRTTVDVEILDVNDNSPQFLRSMDSTDVVENWEVGRHFYHAEATDADSFPNGIVVYDIFTNPDDTFGINRTTGWLFLTRDLQGSTQDNYFVQIRASDLGTPRMTALLDLIITVRDVNNHSPEFAAQRFQTSISETTEVNFRFVDLEATDRDQGTNGLITYSITTGNNGDAFGIFPDGQVYVKNFLDRESISDYILNVEARDGGIPSRTASTELLVEILDENDNRPFFDNSSYIFNLQEGSAIDTIVGTIFATDRDLGDNAELAYSFVENQTQFSLNPITGIIKNLVVFDREVLQAETGQSYFTFDAVVRDKGVVPFQDRSSITIVISDINDNAPVFSRSSYQATISELAENGTHVLRVTASDSDDGDNSYIVYSIMEGNEEKKFHIGRTSGQITLIGLLDRETTSEYMLTIKAQDAGTIPMSKMIGVTIEVLDENDHMPIFTQSQLELEVTECLAIGEPITMVSATDVDIGENGLISYSITDGDIQNAFRVNPDTGDITLSKLLDHETKSSYTLNVTARDSGFPPQTSVTSIIVHVRDCNDNSPVFPQHSVVKWIDEEIILNTLVAIVTASDPDSGINGDIRYSIESQEPDGEHFVINRENGRIVTNARIDYEYLKAHSGVFKVIVKATDQALPRESRRSATSEVVIFVRDINDNSPVFQTHNAVVLSRDATVGSQVTTVTANDPDDGDNGDITYTLINRSVPFEINSETGEVELTRNIEASALSYTLLVNAEDGGQIPGRTSSEITILIVDDTNNGPTFAVTSYTSSISENTAIGTEVVTITAGYLDNTNADIEYYITSVIGGDVPREGDFQMMTTTGVISNGVVLDRELLNADSLYQVTVYAVDRSSTTPRTASTQEV